MEAPLPLLFLPGLLCDAVLWAPQMVRFARSRPCEVGDLTQDDTIAAMAARVLAEAPPRFALVGHSMGGYVAQEVMRQAPERVERLALVATGARQDPPEKIRQRRGLMALARREDTAFRGVTPRLMPELVHASHLHLGPLVMNMAARTGRAAFLRQQAAISARIDSRPSLAGFRLPTLVVVGEEDRMTPPELAEEMAAAIPGARLQRLAQCGHLPSLECPGAFSAALEAWLEQAPVSAGA